MPELNWPIRVGVAIAVLFALIWAMIWGQNPGHLYGDPVLAQSFIYAAQWFLEHGFETYGLPLYGPGMKVYTHLTPGPDYIQTFIAFIHSMPGLHTLDSFRFHSVVTLALSLGTVFVGRHFIIELVRHTLGEQSTAGRNIDRAGWLALLLILSSAGVQVYAPHAYCSGTAIAHLLAVVCATFWARAASADSAGFETFRGSLWISMAGCLFVAFWMGLAPLPFCGLWLLSAVLFFGPRETLAQRAGILAGVSIAIVAVAVGIKLIQNILFLGSWQAVVEDGRSIFSMRQGVDGTTRYSVFIHVAKVGWRLIFLFGAAVPLLLFIGLRYWNSLRQLPWQFLGPIALSAVIWQLLMRGHAFEHIYLLREALFPILFFLTVFFTKMFSESRGRSLTFLVFGIAMFQLAILWGVHLLPSLAGTG